MKLMTKEIEEKIPALYSTEEMPDEKKRIYVKFFHPLSNWTWYATEYDPATGEFFGLVDGDYKDQGGFTLKELESVSVMGLGVERDRYWDDTKTLAKVM